MYIYIYIYIYIHTYYSLIIQYWLPSYILTAQVVLKANYMKVSVNHNQQRQPKDYLVIKYQLMDNG